MVIYLDDIPVFSNSNEEHEEHLHLFLFNLVNILSTPSSPSVNSGFLKSFTLGMSFLVKTSPSILKPSRQSFFGFLRRSSSKSEASSVWQVIAAASLKTSPKSPNLSPTFSRKTTIPLIPACQESFDLLKRSSLRHRCLFFQTFSRSLR